MFFFIKGNLLVIKGQYDKAIAYYDEILNDKKLSIKLKNFIHMRKIKSLIFIKKYKLALSEIDYY